MTPPESEHQARDGSDIIPCRNAVFEVVLERGAAEASAKVVFRINENVPWEQLSDALQEAHAAGNQRSFGSCQRICGLTTSEIDY